MKHHIKSELKKVLIKSAKSRIAILLIINIAATFLWGNLLSSQQQTIHKMADSKTAVPIIMYHSILKNSKRSGTYVITPEQFESDIAYIVDKGYHFITMKELIQYVNKKRAALPNKPIIITFDDGYYNNYLYAYPIIQKYNGRFVLSFIGKSTDQNGESEKLNPFYSHVTWEQIKEMSKSGFVEIQNHTYDLHTVTNERSATLKNSNESLKEYKEFLTQDIMKLQKLLKKKADIVPNTFAYPYGKISPESVEILDSLGFDAALTCYEGINYIGKGDSELLFKLKRFNRPFGKSSANFFKDKLK